MVHTFIRAPMATIVLVQGVARFKIVEFTQTDPYPQGADPTSSLRLLKARLEIEGRLGKKMHATNLLIIAEMIPTIPRELWPRFKHWKNLSKLYIRSQIFNAWIWMQRKLCFELARPGKAA